MSTPPAFFRAAFLRFMNLFRKQKLDRELSAELESHLQLHMEDNLRAGMSPATARRRAVMKLGGLQQTKESVRDHRGTAVLESIVRDIAFTLRQLQKAPAFTAVVVGTLALCIGANTAIYTLLDQTLLRALPVKDPGGLALLRYSGASPGGYSHTRASDHFYFSYPMYRDLRDHSSALHGLLATAWAQVGIQWRKQSEVADAELVSGNYFEVLGLQPAAGRLFVPSDDLIPEANPIVVLSFDYWKERFGADRSIVDQKLLVNGHPFTIVGVAPPGFHSVVPGDAPAVFVPMMMKPQVTPGWNDLDQRRSSWLNIIGRLQPSLTRQQSQAEINSLWYSLRSNELNEFSHNPPQTVRENFLTNSKLFLDDGSKGIAVHNDVPSMLVVAMALAGLVIFVACANVGTLLLVRAGARTREISVRYALGATRSRVFQQMLIEGLVLGFAGGAVGILVAPQISSLLIRQMWSQDAARFALSAGPDTRILAFNFALAFFASLLFTVAPIFQFWRPDLAPALKQQSAGMASGSLRLRQGMVIAQISLSLLLLVGAGLFVRTLHNLKTLRVGFVTDRLIAFSVDPKLAGYDAQKSIALYQQLLEKLAAVPGVRAVAATDDPELSKHNFSTNITVAGYKAAEDENMNVEWARVSSGYFSALQIPLVAGRSLRDADRNGTQRVAVVNETFARRFFLQPEAAVGSYFGKGGGNVKTDIQIVGVARDAKHTSLRSSTDPCVFISFLQEESSDKMTFGMSFYLSTFDSPGGTERTVRQIVQGLDSSLVPKDLGTMEKQIENIVSGERIVSFLASAFGVLSVLLASVGVYGLVSYTTAQRTREIGIRTALGASGASVIVQVLKEVFWLAGIGVVSGLLVSLAFAHLVRSQLFGVTTIDPLTLSAAIGLMAFVTLISAILPARRASKVDPIVALRYE